VEGLPFAAILGISFAMTADAIKDALHTIPFVPFALKVVGGKKYAVPHPDFVAISPTGRTLVLYTEGDRSTVIDIALVSQLERQSSAA
jgi:hypothetical protein